MEELFEKCAANDEESWAIFWEKIDDILVAYIIESYPKEDVDIVKAEIYASAQKYTVQYGAIYLEVTVKRWLYEIS